MPLTAPTEGPTPQTSANVSVISTVAFFAGRVCSNPTPLCRNLPAGIVVQIRHVTGSAVAGTDQHGEGSSRIA